MLPTRTTLFLLMITTAMAGGCTGPVTMAGWKNSVEKYISDRGGDPTVLRDVSWPHASREFSVISQVDPRQSQDARGVLIDYHRVGERPPWYVFIVGIVNRQVVQEIHLAALNVEGSKYRWHLSREDDPATETYRAYIDQLWRGRFPGRNAPPAQYSGFPNEGDVFDVKTQGTMLTATHTPSGAAWKVKLDGP